MEDLLQDRRKFVADLPVQFSWKTLPNLAGLKGH